MGERRSTAEGTCGRWGSGASAVVAVMALTLAGPAAAQDPLSVQGPLVAQASAAGQEPVVFDIAEQDLNAALLLFADRTGLQLVYDIGLVEGLRSASLNGSFMPQDALTRLLAGTGIAFRVSDADTVTLERVALQDNGDTLRLGPVTVTAARTATPVSELAASVTILDRDDIEKQPSLQTQPLDGLKRVVPGIQFNDPAGFDPRLRGRRPSFRVNGVDLLNRGAPSRNDIQDLVGDAFGRIEVVRGADATFGQGASGGAINFITPRPKPGPLQLETSFGLSFAPDGDGPDRLTERVRQSATGTLGKIDYFIGGGFTSFGSEFDPEGDPLPDDTGVTKRNAHEIDWNATLSYNLAPSATVETSHYFVHNFQGERTFQTVFDGQGGIGEKSTVLRSPDDSDTDGSRTHYIGTLKYQNSDFLGNLVSVTGFAQILDEDAIGQGNRLDWQRGKTGLNASVDTALTFLDGLLVEGASLEWGLDYEYAWSGALEFDGAPLQAGLSTHNIAPLAQIRVPVADDFLLSAGVRYEQFFTELDDARDRAFGVADFEGGNLSYGAPLFNASLLYFLSDEIELYGGFSQALEILGIQNATTSVPTASVIEPEPSTTDQFEVGLRGSWSKFQGSVSAFYSTSDSASSFQVISAPQTPTGVRSVPLREARRLWGVEATADWQATNWLSLGGLVAWTDGVRENDEEDWVKLRQEDITPLTISPYIELTPSEPLLFRLQATHEVGTDARREIFNNVDGFSTSAKTFVDLYAQYDSTWGKLSVGIENLFDEFAFSNFAESRNFNRSIPFEGRRITLNYSVEW